MIKGLERIKIEGENESTQDDKNFEQWTPLILYPSHPRPTEHLHEWRQLGRSFGRASILAILVFACSFPLWEFYLVNCPSSLTNTGNEPDHIFNVESKFMLHEKAINFRYSRIRYSPLTHRTDWCRLVPIPRCIQDIYCLHLCQWSMDGTQGRWNRH